MAEAGRAARLALRLEEARGRRLRPPRFDDLGLRRALSDRLLPSLVAAMTFLAALAFAGFVAADALGTRWQHGAGASVTVQVPQPGAPAASDAALTRREAATRLLRAAPTVAGLHALGEGELADLLRPWLGAEGETLTVPLPAVIEVTLRPGATAEALSAPLQAAAPGTLIENPDVWASRLSALARSLQASALLALLVVGGVAVAVVAVATRSGLVSRRAAIEIVHGLGATDGYVSGRFAGRAMLLALIGGAIGALLALPILLELTALSAPFGGGGLPSVLWIGLACLPLATAAIGWTTAQLTVRRWLRRLA